MKVSEEHREIARDLTGYFVAHSHEKEVVVFEYIAKTLAQRDRVMIEWCADLADNFSMLAEPCDVAEAIRALGEE